MTPQGVKYATCTVGFLLVEYESTWLKNGHWLLGVMSGSPGSHSPGKWTLLGIMPPGEIDSPVYATPGIWLAGVSYPVKIDSPWFEPREDWLAGVSYPGDDFLNIWKIQHKNNKKLLLSSLAKNTNIHLLKRGFTNLSPARWSYCQ